MSERNALDAYIETLQILARERDEDRTDAERERDAAHRAKLIDGYAHELAEKIRADIIPELDEYGTREQQAEIDGRRGAADLIDPQKSAGPVRPGEETTP